MIGTILRERYKIIDKLGTGGFAETYLAEDLDIPVTPKLICVVKRLYPTVVEPNIIRLFEQEAQMLHKLGENHPQIPRLNAYFQANQEFYLVQEYIDGHDLGEEITPGKQLSEIYVIKLLQDVLEVLAFVHKNNVIHRDIKPTNIIRRKDGGNLVLIDFGAVKELRISANKALLSSRTIGIGTPGYMPFEQGMGKPKFSSDLYALGMMAIQALTGKLIQDLEEDNQGEIIWKSQVSVSDKLTDFLTKMVRTAWRERYTDATEALKNLPELPKPVEVPKIPLNIEQNTVEVIVKDLSEVPKPIEAPKIPLNIEQNAVEVIVKDLSEVPKPIEMPKIPLNISQNSVEVIVKDLPELPKPVEVPKIPLNIGQNIVEVIVVEPRSFKEVTVIVQTLRERKCIVLNLNCVDTNEEAQRILDFVSSACYHLGGHQERIGESIFLFTPINVRLMGD